MPLLLACAMAPADAGTMAYVDVPGGAFRSAIRYETEGDRLRVASFSLMARPVSNGEFALFLQRRPQWRRDRLPAIFSGPGYLSHWEAHDAPGAASDPQAPVVQVSWYAADAYCRDQQARLPTFLEWEYVAAADATRFDARGDARWQMRLLDDGTPRAMDAAPGARANAYGLHGIHGPVWEWSEDSASLLAGTDRRSGDDGDRLRYCGASSLAFSDRSQYAVLKRFVLMSGLQPADSLRSLGFRCARSRP